MGVYGRPVIRGDVWLQVLELTIELRRSGMTVEAREIVELGARLVLELVRDGRISEELEAEIARLREALGEAAAKAEARG